MAQETGMPKGIGIIDCMLGIPDAEDRGDWFASFRPLIKDKETLEQFAMPAQYMFKDVPQTGHADDYVKWTVEQMHQHGIAQAPEAIEQLVAATVASWQASDVDHIDSRSRPAQPSAAKVTAEKRKENPAD